MMNFYVSQNILILESMQIDCFVVSFKMQKKHQNSLLVQFKTAAVTTLKAHL